jgi:hypothetical protein
MKPFLVKQNKLVILIIKLRTYIKLRNVLTEAAQIIGFIKILFNKNLSYNSKELII